MMARCVEVIDESGSGSSVEAVSGLVESVLKAEDVEGGVTVAFVEEPVIAELNLRYRGVDGSTDVLSFQEDGGGGEWPGDPTSGADGCGNAGVTRELGEVLVCPAVVRRYAAEEGQEPSRQMAWTIIHGVLHLLGYDHEADKGEMREREQALLAELYGKTPLLLADVRG